MGQDVGLTETVPAGTTFTGGDGWTGCDVGAPAGSVCTLQVGGLTAGQSGTATFSVQVDPASAGDVVNEAALSAGYGGRAVRAATTTSIDAPAAVPVVAQPHLTG